MTGLALRLDRFAPSGLIEQAIEAPESADDAFRRGHDEGMLAATRTEMASLTEALKSLTERLEQDRHEALTQRRLATKALTPILGAILEVLGPIGQRERLRDMLTAELTRLVEQAPYRRCTIRCHPDLAIEVRPILNEYNASTLRLDEDPDISGAELSLDGGVIIFDANIVMARLRHSINEICGEEEK